MVTVTNLDILNTSIVRLPLTFVRYLRVSATNNYCNFNCPYCFHKFEYKVNDKYSKRIQNGEIEKYRRFKHLLNFDILYGSSWETLHTEKLVRELDDFLSWNQDVRKIVVNTNGSNPDIVKDLLNRYPNVYFERSYREKDIERSHNNHNLIEHPRVLNMCLVDQTERLSKLNKLSNQRVKFIYRKDVDIDYLGSPLYQDILENPDLFNLDQFKLGFDTFPSCINLLYITPSEECRYHYLAQLRKNKYNRIKTLAEYLDFLLYNYYTNTSPTGSIDDRVPYNINNNMMANIIKYHPKADEVIKAQRDYQAELMLMNSLDHNEQAKELDVLCSLCYINDEDLCYYYSQMFECDIDQIKVSVMGKMNIDSEYIIFKTNKIFMNQLPILIAGRTTDVLKLLSNPFDFNPQGILSKKLFAYIRYKCL